MAKESHYLEFRKVTPLAPFSRYFMFVDTPDHLADELFIACQVRVFFLRKEYILPGDKYSAISCRVWKKDADRFLAALDMLPQKMKAKGYDDYPGNIGLLFGLIIDEGRKNRTETDETYELVGEKENADPAWNLPVSLLIDNTKGSVDDK